MRERSWQLSAGAGGSRGWVLTFVSLGRSKLECVCQSRDGRT